MKQALDLGCLGQGVTLWLKAVPPNSAVCLLAILWQLWTERLGPNTGPQVATAASTASLLDSTGAALSQSPFQSVSDCSNPLGGYILKGDS